MQRRKTMSWSKLRKMKLAFVISVLVVVLLSWAVVSLNLRDEPDTSVAAADPAATAQQIERGAYLARAGNCKSCHTQRGGKAYAGGFGLDTPFGTVYSSNLTPDSKTGLGTWNSTYFWRAMHNGRSRDGRLLYPAFPYPEFTVLTRDDSDAIFGYLRTLAPVEQPNKAHALGFPYNTQMALAVWRSIFFTPTQLVQQPEKSKQWNRGNYLVLGLGHCAACHSPRNALGAISAGSQFSGGPMPGQKWYAPSLLSMQEGSVAEWSTTEIIDLLQLGVSKRGAVSGPMAEVVFGSTQHLSNDDLDAMAIYLKELPMLTTPVAAVMPANPQVLQRGEKIYELRCATCHGGQGQGVVGIYPALAGNRAVTMPRSANLVRVVVSGGFAPTTARNPRPYGMPPFGQTMNNRDLADVLSFMRQGWGNRAPEVSELDVMQAR